MLNSLNVLTCPYEAAHSCRIDRVVSLLSLRFLRIQKRDFLRFSAAVHVFLNIGSNHGGNYGTFANRVSLSCVNSNFLAMFSVSRRTLPCITVRAELLFSPHFVGKTYKCLLL